MDAAGYLLLGEARLALRQFAPASDAFAASIALAGDNAEVIYYLVRSYQVLANESFSRMEELAPDSWRTHQMRAEVYKLRYDDPQAIREYERAAQFCRRRWHSIFTAICITCCIVPTTIWARPN